MGQLDPHWNPYRDEDDPAFARPLPPTRREVEKLCREHDYVVVNESRRLKTRVGHRADLEELRGDGYLGLVRAAQTWLGMPMNRRTQFGGEFGALATQVVRNAMIDGLRKTYGRHFQRMDTLSLDAPIDTDANETMTLGDTLVDHRSDVVTIVEARETLVEKVLGQQSKKSKKAEAEERRSHRSLTPPELEVLAGAALGESSKVTAARLHKAQETIKSQRRSVISKLGAADITNAVYLAARQGLFARVAA